MKCTTCGAPATPGATICDYCGQVIAYDGGAQTPAASPGPRMAPGGAVAGVPGPPGSVTRALASDGYWYPVAASPLEGGRSFLVRFDDGYQATMYATEVRPPCRPHEIQPGARVVGEFEQLYYPGTVRQVMGNAWEVVFDDGRTAVMPADRLALHHLPPAQPLPPGTRVLAQGPDGSWCSGQVFTGLDPSGRQGIRLDQGGMAACLPCQLNGPLGPQMLQPGRRVLGIGEEYRQWYPGTVQQAAHGTAQVKFDSGEVVDMAAYELRPII